MLASAMSCKGSVLQVIPMDMRHRGIQILGCLAIIAGCLVGLRLIRGLIVGHIANFWMLLGDVLFAALAVYLVYVGRRGLAFAKGQPRPKPKIRMGANTSRSNPVIQFREQSFSPFPHSHRYKTIGTFEPDTGRSHGRHGHRHRNRLHHLDRIGNLDRRPTTGGQELISFAQLTLTGDFTH